MSKNLVNSEPMEIISVLNESGQIVLRHSPKLNKYYEAISNFQDETESFSASSKNPHFKNNFAPLPKMLIALNSGYRKFGLCQTKHVCGEYLVCRTFHIESEQFIETWAKLPSIDIDINKFKGVLTSLDRYVTGKECNLGAEVDDDNSSTHGGEPKTTPSFIKPTESTEIKPKPKTKAFLTPSSANFEQLKSDLKSGKLTMEDISNDYTMVPATKTALLA